jgi:hypothetical protein
MSTPNVPEVQILVDTGDRTVVKIVGYYTAATNSNTQIIQANTLAYANSSKPCVLSCISIQYAAGFANGYALLQWVGTGAGGNSDLAVVGGKTSSVFEAYMPNPLAANTANLNHGLGGDLGLTIQGAIPGDGFTLILKLNKEGDAGGGYANVYTQYNDNTFHP